MKLYDFGLVSIRLNLVVAKNNKNSLKFDEIADAFFGFRLEKEPDNATNIKEQRLDYEIYHKDKLGNLAATQINHISPYKMELKKPNNKRERFLELIEIELLRKEVASKEDFALELFVELALCTGARLEGILNIKKKDLALSTKSVTISDFKTKSTYTGFLSKRALEMINQIYTALSPNDFLVNKPKATILNVLQPLLNKLFNQNLDISDATNRVVIHTLRHTFASHLAIKGTPILTIKKLMNHSDINHTLRYAKLMPDSGREMVESLYE